MKIKVFDVVELNNGNKATILSIDEDVYKAEVVTSDGKSKGISNLEEKDIKEIIFKRYFVRISN